MLLSKQNIFKKAYTLTSTEWLCKPIIHTWSIQLHYNIDIALIISIIYVQKLSYFLQIAPGIIVENALVNTVY